MSYEIVNIQISLDHDMIRKAFEDCKYKKFEILREIPQDYYIVRFHGHEFYFNLLPHHQEASHDITVRIWIRTKQYRAFFIIPEHTWEILGRRMILKYLSDQISKSK